MDVVKAYAEQTAEERIVSLDRMLNVLVHPDWSHIQLRFSDEAVEARRLMEEAASWEAFVAARAVYLFVQQRVLGLRDAVTAEKNELEANKAADEPRWPTDYERE